MLFWKPKPKPKETDQITEIKEEEKPVETPKNAIEEKIAYHCSKCNYSFKRKASQNTKVCPYCGSDESTDTEKNSSEILGQ